MGRKKTIIEQDMYGLFARVGGWIARTKESRFIPGDSLIAHHFGGSKRVGVGKLPDAKSGQYIENWWTSIEESKYNTGTIAFRFNESTLEIEDIKYGADWQYEEPFEAVFYK